MSESVDLALGLDVGDYVQGATRAAGATRELSGVLGGLSATSLLVARAMQSATPSRVTIAAFGGFGAMAAQSQQALSGLDARARTTGQSMSTLRAGISSVAREFPVGNANARATVQTLQQLGVAGQGSERRVVALARSFTQLSGATGESAQGLASSQTQLSRMFGSLDVKRIDKLNDSLVTTSARAGTSAGSVLAFSKAIAPMTQAAGIGQTATMGISAAFTRLGEDGYLAANTFNKMLSDLNRSVREGSTDMAAYAEITGTTVENFEKLFKSNPTEAITQVTEAVAKAGAAGPRQLEMIGVEGVRGQRTLQALAASGGLRSQVATAVNAYGDDSTRKAAETAYGGLNDALTKVRTTAEQTATALGRPLLGPLEAITEEVGEWAKVAQSAAESKGGQALITAGLAGAAAAVLGRGLIRMLAGTALVQQAATSGPVRSAFGGYATGRAAGDQAAAAGTRAGRYGAAMIGQEQAGTLRAGMMGPLNERIYGAAQNFGLTRAVLLEQRDARMAPAGMTGPQYREELNRRRAESRAGGSSGLRGVISRAALPLSMAAEGAMRMAGDAQSQVAGRGATDPGVRPGQSLFNAQGAFRALGTDLRQAAQNMNPAGGSRLEQTNQAWRRFNSNLQTGANGMGNFARVANGAVQMIGANTRYGAGIASAGIGTAARGLSGALGGPVGIGIMGAMVGAQVLGKQKEAGEAESDRLANMSVYDTLNGYRDSMGKAGEAGQTLADQAAQAARTMNDAVETFSQARRVSQEDIQQAGVNNRVQREMTGTPQQMAAQIAAMNINGITPEELQTVKVDLLRQMPGSVVEQVIAQVPEGGQTLTGRSQNGGIIAAASDAESRNPLQTAMQSLFGNEQTLGRAFAAGGRYDFDKLEESAANALDSVAQNIGQRYATQGDAYGNLYAEQERIRGVNQAMAEAVATGNDNVTAELSKRLSRSLTGEEQNITAAQIRDAGGFVQALAAMDKDYGRTLREQRGQGVVIGNRGGIEGNEQLSPLAQRMSRFGTPSGQWFSDMYNNTSAFAGRPANEALATARNAPESAGALTDAVEAMITEGRNAGKSFGEIATMGTLAANTLESVGSADYKIQRAMSAQADFRMQAALPEMRPGQQLRERFMRYRGQANLDPNNPEMAAERQQGAEGLSGLRGEVMERMRGYLQMQRQSAIAQRRSGEDYQRTRGYADEDFTRSQGRSQRSYDRSRVRAEEQQNRSIERAQADHHRTMQRAAEDFERSRARATEDYAIQRERSERSFQTSTMRAEEDYFVARERAQRDFGLQMKRMAEDQAKSIYDPFKRIQTQAVWDGQQLLMNLSEQNAAMVEQARNLDKLRAMGVNQNVIDTLGLGRSENAQQLAMLAADFSSDPRLIEQFNNTVQARLGASAGLTNQSQEVRRAQEDFRTSMGDQESDFRKSMARSREDFNLQMVQAAEDFVRSMTRQSSDFATSMSRMQTDFSTSMRRSSADFDIAMRQMATDFATSMSDAETDHRTSMLRMETQYNVSLRRMREDVVDAQTEISGSFQTLHEQTRNALNGRAVEWGKLMVDGLNDTLTQIKDLQPAWNEAMGGFAFQPNIYNPMDGSGGGSAGDSDNPYFNPLRGNYRMSSDYGMRTHPITGARRMHTGRDFAAPAGTPVYSALDGTVIFAGVAGGYGNRIIVDHGNGRQTTYNHLSSMAVRSGQHVEGNTRLGGVGTTGNSTGNHLHFEAKLNGSYTNPDIVPSWATRAPAGDRRGSSGTFGPAPVGTNAPLLPDVPYRGASTNYQPDSAYRARYPVDKQRNYAIARSMLPRFGWGAEHFNALVQLWGGESGWNQYADNPSSSAYGIPQALPGSKMSSAGPAWRTDPATQMAWGLGYIRDRYRTPNGALSFWQRQRPHWYGNGSIFTGPQVIGVGERGPEAVIPLDHRGVALLANALSKVVSTDQLTTMTSGQRTTAIHYHGESYTYDHRTEVTGDITVVTDDPDEMARKLARKARSDALAPMGPHR